MGVNSKVLTVLIICSLLAGCQGGNQDNPIQPDPIPYSLEANAGINGSHRQLLGYWQVSISGDRQDVAFTPLRVASLHLNAVNILETIAPVNCLVVEKIVGIPPDILEVDVKITHPYPGYSRYTGFDSRGIFITGGDYTFPDSGHVISVGGRQSTVTEPGWVHPSLQSDGLS